jgi:hypothetical protein
LQSEASPGKKLGAPPKKIPKVRQFQKKENENMAQVECLPRKNRVLSQTPVISNKQIKNKLKKPTSIITKGTTLVQMDKI